MSKSILNLLFIFFLVIHGCHSTCLSDVSNIQVTNGDKTISVSWSAASGPAPIVYNFLSTIDNSIPHDDLTVTSFQFDDLEDGLTFDATFQVTAKCNNIVANTVSKNTVASTKPATPVLTIIVDEDLEVLLALNFTGQAESFTFEGSAIPSGSETVAEETYLVTDMKKDQTYTFMAFTTLNGINSDSVEVTHITSKKATILGLEPWTFAIIMIVAIVLIALIIVVVIVVLCCLFRRKGAEDEDLSSEDARKGEGEDSSEPQQAWEYKDPFETVEYKVNEATRKRALAIAIQNAAIKP